MKKKLLVLLPIVLTYLGTTGYIANNIENKSQKIIKRLEAKYADMGLSVEATFKDKSFFTSQMDLVVDVKNAQSKGRLSAFYQLPIVLHYKVEHGPLLFRDGMGIGMVGLSMDTSLSQILESSLVDRLKLKETDMMIHSTSQVSFGKNISSIMDVSGWKLANKEMNMNIDIAPFMMTSDMNLEHMTGKMQWTVPSLKMSDFKQDMKHIELEEMTAKLRIDSWVSKDIYLGKVNLVAKRFHLKNKEDKTDIDLGMAFDVLMGENRDKDLKVIYTISGNNINATVPNENFGSPLKNGYFSLKTSIDGLSPTGMQKFQDYMTKIQEKRDLVLSTDQNNSANMAAYLAESQNISRDIFILAQEIFTEKKAKIGLDLKLGKENDDVLSAKADFAYQAEVVRGTVNEMSEAFVQNLFTSLFAQIDVSLKASFWESIKAVSPADKKQSMEMGLQMAMGTGMIVKKGDNYTLNVDYSPNKLTINGTDKSGDLLMIKGKFVK